MLQKLKLAVCLSWLLILPLADQPAGAMGNRPSLAQNRPHLPSGPEALLVKSLLEIKNNHLNSALRDVEALLKINPNFRLAHLIHGDLLLARAQAISAFGNAPNAPQQRVADLKEEAQTRLQHYLEPTPANLIPENLLQFDPEQRYAVVVDTGKSRLYLYSNRNGEPHYVTDYYITSGRNGSEKAKEGDQRTPLGVYFVTSSLPRERLTGFYGIGAFPLSYPNEWDRQQGNKGHGIWLHGVPSDTYSRPPRASSGCVVLTNQDLGELEKVLQIGLTPVIISSDVSWIKPDEWRAQRDALKQQMENWRHDWESLNTERYLGHYSTRFFSGGQNYAAWAQQKRLVNTGKSSLKVNLSHVSIFRYPGKEHMVVVTFFQDYHSNNLSNQMRKRQYWIQEGSEWKIIYEGAA